MASETGPPARRVPVPAGVALGAAFMVSLAVRAPRMLQSVWYDEYCRTHAVLNRERLADLLLHDVHNPLYNAFMYAWIGVFGDSDVSIRVPSLVAGYGSLALFCVLLRRRVGAWAAWGVGVWSLFSPVHVWYSTEAKNNMFVLAMATLALWAADRLVERPTPGRTVWAAAGLLGVFYADLVGSFVIAALLVWMLGEAWRRRRADLARAAAVVAIVTIVGVFPWVVFKAAHLHDLWRGYLEPFRPREVSELLGGMFVTGHAFTPLKPERTWAAVAAMAVVAPLLALGARSLWRSGGSRVIVLLMLFGVGGMAVTSAVVDAVYEGREHFIYQPRNLLCVLYVFGAVMWTGLGRVRPRTIRFAGAGVLAGTALAATVVMQTLHDERFTVDRPRSDWRRLAALIEADAGGAPAAAVSRSPVLQLERYAENVDATSTWGGACGVTELATAEAAGTAKGAGGLYYVDDRDWWPVSPEDVSAWRAAYDVREVGRVDRVIVYALDRR